MANWRPVMYGGVPLLRGSAPVMYDADEYPGGPPEECCCPPLCDLRDWHYLTFYDQTGDCICLPDAPLFDAESDSVWTTNTCPGNTTYTLACDEETGLPTLLVGGLGFATLLLFDPPVEILFQLPAMGVNCGVSGGTAKVRITPTP